MSQNGQLKMSPLFMLYILPLFFGLSDKGKLTEMFKTLSARLWSQPVILLKLIWNLSKVMRILHSLNWKWHMNIPIWVHWDFDSFPHWLNIYLIKCLLKQVLLIIAMIFSSSNCVSYPKYQEIILIIRQIRYSIILFYNSWHLCVNIGIISDFYFHFLES